MEGVNDSEATVIDAGARTRCFDLGSSYCVIRNLTLVNGSGWAAEGDGGAVACLNTNPIIRNCIISNCVAASGGGVHKGRVYDSVIVDNSASFGSGGGLDGSIASNCTIYANSAYYRGGGMNSGQATNCRIYDNIVEGGSYCHGGGCYGVYAKYCIIYGNGLKSSNKYDGGGVYGGRSDSCIISNNFAYIGAGAHGGYLTNCIVVDNNAHSGAGGYTTVAVNCLIKDNRADYYYGGMYRGAAYNCVIVENEALEYGAMSGGTVYNTIIYYNSAILRPNTAGTTFHNSCCPDAVHGTDGNITNSPVFVDRTTGDYRLRSQSPCIDAGNNASSKSSVDLDGRDRIVGASIDIGAYEYDENIPCRIHAQSDGVRIEFDRYSPTREFTVLWTGDLVSDSFVPLQRNIPFPVSFYTDRVHLSEADGFYKVIAEYPE